MKKKLFKTYGLAIALLASGLIKAQTATPVTITSGFNQDIIANGVGNASASTTMSFDQTNTRALVSYDFKATASSAAPTYALPSNGVINSATTTGVAFQLAPYSGNNALFLTPSYVNNGAPNTGTLSFNTSNATTLYLLAGATGGGNQYLPFIATVTFSDGTSQTASLTISDWYNGTGYAIQGIGRVNTTNNNLEGAFDNPRLYEVAVALNASNYSKTITGIAFSFAGDSSAEWASEIRLSVLAVSKVAAPAIIDVTTQGAVPASITTNDGTLQLVATVTPTTAGAISWSITQGSAFATVSPTGLVSAIANGVVTVRATLNSNADIYDDIVINITNQAIPVTGVTANVLNNAPATITANDGTLTLTAAIAPANATNTGITWAVTSGAEFATVSATGVVTALANGTVTVTVTTADGNFTDTIDIVITGQVITVTAVAVSVENNAAATITTDGGTLQLVAAVTPANATNTGVTWAVTSGSEYASVSVTGLVTALTNGTVTVTVTSADGSFTDTIDIVITGQVIPVTGVTVAVENNAAPTIITAGGTLQLTATVVPADATEADVVWSITSGSEFVSIGANGLVTALANGTAVIRATAEGSTIFGEITITVNVPTSGTVDFDTAEFSIYPNPTEGIVTLKSAVAIKSVTVYDNLGREVYHQLAQESINLENLTAGIYIIKADFENNVSKTIKVIKE